MFWFVFVGFLFSLRKIARVSPIIHVGTWNCLRKTCASDPPGLLPSLTSFLTCLSLQSKTFIACHFLLFINSILLHQFLFSSFYVYHHHSLP
ncbi:hypothetical protein GLYMA_04G182650v4 [Glycine max]|nr:hypothetical protein GLYMA_04G182650v4 [Glycine max]KAH1111937.1 hypothetical protein GYH30_010341 [Glycine max]